MKAGTHDRGTKWRLSGRMAWGTMCASAIVLWAGTTFASSKTTGQREQVKRDIAEFRTEARRLVGKMPAVVRRFLAKMRQANPITSTVHYSRSSTKTEGVAVEAERRDRTTYVVGAGPVEIGLSPGRTGAHAYDVGTGYEVGLVGPARPGKTQMQYGALLFDGVQHERITCGVTMTRDKRYQIPRIRVAVTPDAFKGPGSRHLNKLARLAAKLLAEGLPDRLRDPDSWAGVESSPADVRVGSVTLKTEDDKPLKLVVKPKPGRSMTFNVISNGTGDYQLGEWID